MCIEWFNFYQYKMTQCNSLKAKLWKSQFNKLNSAVQNIIEALLRLSSNMVSTSDHETHFPHKLLLIDKLQIFVKLLQLIHQLILSYQQLSCLKWYSQEDFLVEFLVHY